MLHLAATVRFAHQMKPPLVHRDLKPANILVQRGADGKFSLRVADFGISSVAASQAIDEAARTPTSRLSLLPTAVRGAYTLVYASPQQVRGEPADPRDDVHALGVIWYQMLTGDLSQGPPTDWRDELAERGVPGSMIDLLGRCVAGRPERRLTDAAALVQQLEALLQANAGKKGGGGGGDLDDVAAQVEQAMQRVRQAHAVAKQKAERDHDYAAAATLLEQVPEHLRDAGLYTSVCQKRDRVRVLEPEIRAAAKELRFAGLRPKVEELLQLLPQRTDLQRLLATLPKELARELVNSLGMRFAFIPAGRFLMGSPESENRRSGDEGPQHEVEITHPFYLGIHQVTQEQYKKVIGKNPSHFKSTVDPGGLTWNEVHHPVESVSWEDAVEFCRELSARPVERAVGRSYRLPTEAEWEYACRGGANSSNPFFFGSSLSSAQANFDGNLQRTTPVGSYQPNAFGLYDMHGNVWEWCADWYDRQYYQLSPRQNPQGPQNGSARVLRGGSWNSSGFNFRSAVRFYQHSDTRSSTIGFRVVCSPGTS